MRVSRQNPIVAASKILDRVKISQLVDGGGQVGVVDHLPYLFVPWIFQLGLQQEFPQEGRLIRIRCWTELILQSDIRVVGSTWNSYQVYESPYPEVIAYIAALPDIFLYTTK